MQQLHLIKISADGTKKILLWIVLFAQAVPHVALVSAHHLVHHLVFHLIPHHQLLVHLSRHQQVLVHRIHRHNLPLFFHLIIQLYQNYNLKDTNVQITMVLGSVSYVVDIVIQIVTVLEIFYVFRDMKVQMFQDALGVKIVISIRILILVFVSRLL